MISLNRVVLPWQKFWGQVNDHERNPRGVFNLDHENDISLGRKFVFRHHHIIQWAKLSKNGTDIMGN